MDKKYLISFLALIVITTCIISFIFYVIFNLKPIDESLIQLNVNKETTVFATKQPPQLTTKGNFFCFIHKPYIYFSLV